MSKVPDKLISDRTYSDFKNSVEFKGSPSPDEVEAVIKALLFASSPEAKESLSVSLSAKPNETLKAASVWSDKSFIEGRVPISDVSWRFSARFL